MRREPTYGDYVAHVDAALDDRDRTHWRAGQTYFNVLYQLRPNLADAARGTQLDPFHRDDRVPAFLRWVRDNWDVPQPDDRPDD